MTAHQTLSFQQIEIEIEIPKDLGYSTVHLFIVYISVRVCKSDFVYVYVGACAPVFTLAWRSEVNLRCCLLDAIQELLETRSGVWWLGYT